MQAIIRLRVQFCLTLTAFMALIITADAQRRAFFFNSVFGLKAAGVGEMRGFPFVFSRAFAFFDLTHEIPAYNIWEASFRLGQAAGYWPKGTVFVSIVDP